MVWSLACRFIPHARQLIVHDQIFQKKDHFDHETQLLLAFSYLYAYRDSLIHDTILYVRIRLLHRSNV